MLTRNPPHGFSFIELMVVVSILALAAGMAFLHSRNASPAATNTATQLAFHMKVRQATDELTEQLYDGSEVVKPLMGTSLNYLVVRSITNLPQVFYLESAPKKSQGPNILVTYTDDFSGVKRPSDRKTVCENVKEITFTTVSPGLVIVLITFLDPGGQELPSIIQAPLKNVSTTDG